MAVYYFLKLNPRRNDFAQTMTTEEREIMMQHIAYWREEMKRGSMQVFGPVFDPAAVYGVGIIKVDDEAQLKKLLAGDPASTINDYEYHLMNAVTREMVE